MSIQLTAAQARMPLRVKTRRTQSEQIEPSQHERTSSRHVGSTASYHEQKLPNGVTCP